MEASCYEINPRGSEKYSNIGTHPWKLSEHYLCNIFSFDFNVHFSKLTEEHCAELLH